jgi:hypothetical protein
MKKEATSKCKELKAKTSEKKEVTSKRKGLKEKTSKEKRGDPKMQGIQKRWFTKSKSKESLARWS